MNAPRSYLTCMDTPPIFGLLSSSIEFGAQYMNKDHKCINRQRYVKVGKNSELIIEEYILLGVPDEGWARVGHSYWKVDDEVTEKGVKIESFIQDSPYYDPKPTVSWIDAVSLDTAVNELLNDIENRKISIMFFELEYSSYN